MSNRQPSRSTVRLIPPTTVVGLEHSRRDVCGDELGGGGQPCRAGADDDDIRVGPGLGREGHLDLTSGALRRERRAGRVRRLWPRRSRRACRGAARRPTDCGTRRSCGAGPSARSTFGSQPSTERARVMSGRRTVGSSSGRGTCCERARRSPTRSRTSSASSVIDTSCGLPMLTGPGCVECSSRMHALDQVVDVLDRAGLAAVAGHGHRLAAQRLPDERRHGAPVVGAHPRAVRVEDPHDRGVDALRRAGRPSSSPRRTASPRRTPRAARPG